MTERIVGAHACACGQYGANPYVPMSMEVLRVRDEVETRTIKTFDLGFADQADVDQFAYMPGQFCEVSVFGAGESPFGIASSPTEEGFVRFTVSKAGVVTHKLHALKPGDVIGMRGPLGNYYPVELMRGKDVVIIGGGFAFTTLRSLIIYMLEEREAYGKITVVYGARTPGLLMYSDELDAWDERDDIDMVQTIDAPAEGWTKMVGFVPTAVQETAPDSTNAIAVICGPPVMIRFTLPVMTELGFQKEQIYTSLENRMQCGIGKCGRCNVGHKYVCLDGPVFSLAELDQLPPEY